jgi:hypothetical protein
LKKQVKCLRNTVGDWAPRWLLQQRSESENREQSRKVRQQNLIIAGEGGSVEDESDDEEEDGEVDDDLADPESPQRQSNEFPLGDDDEADEVSDRESLSYLPPEDNENPLDSNDENDQVDP